MVKAVFTYFIFLISIPLYSQSFEVKLVQTPLKGNVFSPAYWKNNLIVCSDQKDRIYKTVKDNNGLEPADLYIINTEKSDSVARFDQFFRTQYHDGPISFSDDFTQVAISRNLKADQKIKQLNQFENKLGIYFTQLTEGQYREFESFTFNNEAYNVTHPYLNATGDLLYFSSNMPGGHGGYDIYYSTKSMGIWKKPINLGPEVNTKNDEVFPSIDAGNLFFSSNRNEVGGLDIYSYLLNSNHSATLLDTSLNSIYDDFGLISSNNLETGFFTSNRNGKDEIFRFTYEYPEFGPCDSIVETYFCYEIEDEYAVDIDNLEGLVYVWNINGEQLYGVKVDYCFPEPGDYEITLDIVDTIVNQTFFEQSYLYISIQLEEQPYIECPDTVQVNQTFDLSAEKTYLPSLSIEDDDYYWLIDGTARLRGKNVTYQFTEEGIYEVQLGVIGFDGEMKIQDCSYKTVVCGSSTSTDKDHVSLFSENPKENKGVNIIENQSKYADPSDSSAFFTIEIAKASEEIASNDFRLKLLEGKYDYKLKYLEEEELFIYYVGAFKNIEEAHEFWKELRLLGLQDAVVRTLLENEGEINLDDIFVLNNVKFDSDKWTVREDAQTDLNKILELMNNIPGSVLIINAYTDNTHTEKYNLELSEKRAQSIANYLIKRGISSERLIQHGFGESNPIASNETEQGKELNRRVEFILKSE
ncbi:MAG: OmpA family protein [Crocinitomicaceae bacterium]